MNNNLVQVAVGVITKLNKEDKLKYFVTKRLAEAHQGDKWEFPGGKVEKEETVAQALARELKEEIAIEVLTCQQLMVINHDYGDKRVSLDVYIVDNYLGEPSAQEGQEQGWFSITELSSLDFPAANKDIIDKLITRER